MNKDKELEEAIKVAKYQLSVEDKKGYCDIDSTTLGTLLQALDEEKYFNKIHEYHMKYNFIPKKKIEEYRNKFIKESKKEKVFMTQSSQINASLISFCEKLLEDK